MSPLFGTIVGGTTRWAASTVRLWRGCKEHMARAPLSQRGLALGTALAVLLALLLPQHGGSASQGLWVAVLVGGGIALMGLPQALGWTEAALLRVGTLALAFGLLAMIILTRVAVDSTTGEQLRLALAIASVGAVLLPCAVVSLWPQAALLLGPLAVPVWATVTLFAGAALLLLGFSWSFWPEAGGAAANVPLAEFIVWATLTWAAALAAHRFEATRGLCWAGRLLALRSGLICLGGVVLAWSVALFCVPWLEVAAARAAFGTPMEGMAPAAGMLAGVLLALSAAGVFLGLPGVFARAQLAGRSGVAEVGEAAWVLALVLFCMYILLPLAAVAYGLVLDGDPTLTGFIEVYSDASAMFVMVLSALTHGTVRVLLGRPPHETSTPLWVVLPGADLSPPTLATAVAAARMWADGTVTLLAHPAAAPRLLGPHLRLARQASLPALFARSSSDALAWQRDLPDDAGRNSLPLREAYCAAPAAAALLAGLPQDARVLVLLDGPMATGWGDALAALPPHSLRLARAEGLTPPGVQQAAQRQAPHGWHQGDFADRAKRERLLADFAREHRPHAAGERRILIVHGEADRATAQRLAALLDRQTDAAGRLVRASIMPPRYRDAILSDLPQAWSSAWPLIMRALDRGEFGSVPIWQGMRLWGALFGQFKRYAAIRLDFAVLEYGFPDLATMPIGIVERCADKVLSIRPATTPAGAFTFYEESAYTDHLTLPPASALGSMLPMVAQEILNEAFVAPDTAKAATLTESQGLASVAASAADAKVGSSVSAPPEPAENRASATLPANWHDARTRIFISRGKQASGTAQKLRDALEQRLGHEDASVFVDQTEPLVSMETPHPATDEALNTSTHFILLASGDHGVSAWRRMELEAATRRHDAEGHPQLFCVFADEAPEALQKMPFHHAFRYLGPFNEERQLVALTRQNDERLSDEIRQLADQFTSAVFSGPRLNRRSSPIVLSYVPEYAEFGEMLTRSLQMRGVEVESNVGLLDGEARLLHLSHLLVVLTGPALNNGDGHTQRDPDIALAFGLRVATVRVAPAETRFALRESTALNERYLSELDSTTLIEEIERTAQAIAQTSTPMSATEDREAEPPAA